MNCLFSNRKRKFHSSKTRLVEVVVAVGHGLRGRMAETRVAGLSITQLGRG